MRLVHEKIIGKITDVQGVDVFWVHSLVHRSEHLAEGFCE
jgi:hypothetical protein